MHMVDISALYMQIIRKLQVRVQVDFLLYVLYNDTKQANRNNG